MAEMKILHISARADIGGGQESMMRLMRATSDRVLNYASSPKEEPYWSRFEGLVGTNRMCEIPHRTVRLDALLRLIEFTKRNRVQVIHAHGLGAGLYARLVTLATGIPNVYTFHGLIFKKNNLAWTLPRLLIELVLCCFSKHLVAVSRSEKDHIAHWLSPHREKLRTIHNGIVATASGPLETPSSLRKILWVGRFAEQKDPIEMVQIAAELKDMFVAKGFVIDVIGEGPLMSKAKEVSNSLGTNDVINFLGAQPSAMPFYEKSQTLLSTSKWEGLPNNILEAQSFGLLVICSEVLGNTDLVSHGQTGYLYKKGDYKQAAAMIADSFINRSRELPIRRRAQEAIRSKFSMSACAENYFKLYSEVVNSNRGNFGSSEELKVSRA